MASNIRNPKSGKAGNQRKVESEKQMMSISDAIIDSVRDLQEIYRQVFPWMVADAVFVSERTARRYMSRLAAEKMLVRIGQRKGYYVQ